MIKIRPIVTGDIDSIVALGGSLISKDDILKLDPGGHFDVSLVAEVESSIVGYILARIVYQGIPLTKLCNIFGIIVDHEYRRQGIGEKLVTILADQCQKNGIRTIRALVDENDTRLVDFTKQLGFQVSFVANYDLMV